MSKKTNNKAENKQESKASARIVNKKAKFNFQLLEKLEAGIALKGTEVKSLREGRASLEEAYCRIQNGELYLIGCNIMPYSHGNIMNHEPLRNRKLLIHRREIHKIEVKLNQKGLTLVPTRIYFTRGLAKCEIALAKGKTLADKREKLKSDQIKLDISREIKKWR